jgi:hypothetical protein
VLLGPNLTDMRRDRQRDALEAVLIAAQRLAARRSVAAALPARVVDEYLDATADREETLIAAARELTDADSAWRAALEADEAGD